MKKLLEIVDMMGGGSRARELNIEGGGAPPSNKNRTEPAIP
jgi:hypothetical protein